MLSTSQISGYLKIIIYFRNVYSKLNQPELKLFHFGKLKKKFTNNFLT